MAIGRITGQMLSANLARSGTDLAFETNLLVLDVTNSRVGVGTASPATTLHVSATDAIRLPSGSNAQRPGSPANGDIRYNTDGGNLEGYSGGAWATLVGEGLDNVADDTSPQLGGDLDVQTNSIVTATDNRNIEITPHGSGSVVLTKVDVAAGEIDGTAIGANSASTGAFTTLTASGNATITGNLTVNGTTTTVATTNTTISDNIIELNSGISASSNDAGLIIERGSTGNNAAILWDESADKFTMGTTTATAADKSSGITVTKGTLVADLEGDVTGALTGNADTATALATARNIAGVSFDGSADISIASTDLSNTSAIVLATSTHTLTNKTIDANGTGNNISNLDSGNFLSGFFLDEDAMGSNDATAVASQQSIKAYVDAQDANIAADTLTFTNKTIDANGTGNNITNIDSGNFLSGFFLDENNMASDSATAVASQQSIKAYVDAEVSAVSTTSISQLNTSATVSDSGSNGAFTVVADGNTDLVINDTSATFSGNVIMSGDLTVNGTTTTVATTNTTISDNIIELNSGISASSNDSGILIERGSTGNNAFIGWDESEDKFTVGTTTATAGDKSGGITVTKGTLVADLEGDVTGDVTGTVSDISNHLLDEDAMGSNDATKAPSQQSVKAYVDAQDANIAGDTLTFTNKTIDANGTGNNISNIDSGNFLSGFFLDEDAMGSNSATSVASQQSIKAYVDAQVTAQDLDFTCDDSTTLSIDLDSESLQFSGGTGITTAGTGNTVTVAIDSTVATLTGSQTLTNKTLTSPVLNTGVSGTAVLDEDNMASDSATQLATQQSIKAYVDAEDANIAGDTLTFTNKTIDANGTGNNISNIDIGNMTAASIVLESEGIGNNDNDTTLPTSAAVKDFVDTAVSAVSTTAITQLNTSATVSDSGSNGAFTVVADGNTELVINDTSATFSGNVIMSGNLTVNGSTTTIDSTTLTIEDPMITLAKNNSGGDANTFDQGLFFNRGSLDNVSMLWDESEDEFVMAVTSGEDGTTAGNVTIDSYAGLHAGVTTVTDLETGSISAADGTAAATIADSTGVITIPSSVLTTADINGGTADGVTIGGSTAAAGTFTTATAVSVQATNIKANDGTAAITVADSSGAVKITTAFEVDGAGFIFNESSAAVDFRVESNGHAHALFVDGSEDHVGIKTATPAYDLDISGSTDAINLPQGNTAARPTAAAGIIRFNSQTGQYEGCQDGSTFINFATAGSAPTFTKESTTGDGSTTTFTGFFSSAPESANNVFVYIDNVYQEPTENYSVSGTNITFTSAPHSGARIFAITGADGTALATGGVARSETSSTNFTSSATNIFTSNGASYRSAEIYVQMTDTANTEYSAMKGVVVHDGTTAFITVFGITNTGSSDLGTLTATYNSGTVEVKAVSTGGQTAAQVQYSLASV